MISQHPILTLTLNPTIDGSAEAERIEPIHKIRTSNERYSAGGGGINVARVVNALGGNAAAIYLTGGTMGGVLEKLVDEVDIGGEAIRIQGATRIAHSVFERATGTEYRFVPEGPEIANEEWASCRAAISGRPWDYLVASGSLPPSAPADAYAELAAIARRRHARLVLDTSGEALAAALEEGVFLVKPSLRELESLVGRRLEEEDQRLEAAEGLVRAGKAEVLALSLGREGALLVTRQDRIRLRAPAVEAKSAVGAGDSFVGAMALKLSRGEAVANAFAYGVAAGTAAVLAPGHEVVRPADVERFYGELVVSAAHAAGPEVP